MVPPNTSKYTTNKIIYLDIKNATFIKMEHYSILIEYSLWK